MSTSTKVNADAIANLTAVLRDQVMQSHGEFKKIATDVLWLNVTIFGQTTLFMHIRQLEFTLLQLTQQVDRLFNSIQCAIQGKLSIEVVIPVVLQSILRNVSLQLPQKFQRLAGTHINDIHLYYELIKVSVIANAHCVHLILSVPLQSADRHYTLFRIITLPIRVTSDKFIQYCVDYTYFGLERNEQNYL